MCFKLVEVGGEILVSEGGHAFVVGDVGAEDNNVDF